MGVIATRGSVITGSATAADHVTFSSPAVSLANPGILVAAIAYNDSHLTNSVQTVTADSVNFTFAASTTSGTGAVSYEIWYIDVRKLSSLSPTAVTISFTVGASLSIHVSLISIHQVNTVPGLAQSTHGAGTVSPMTKSAVAQNSQANKANTILTPVTSSVLFGFGVAYRSTSAMTLSLSVGTALLAPVDTGSGITRITCAIATQKGNGSTQSIRWTESVNREWTEIIVEFVPTAVTEPIRAGSHTPTFFN